MFIHRTTCFEYFQDLRGKMFEFNWNDLIILAGIFGGLVVIFLIILLWVLFYCVPKFMKSHQCSIDRDLEHAVLYKGQTYAATNDRKGEGEKLPTTVPTRSLTCTSCGDVNCTSNSP